MAAPAPFGDSFTLQTDQGEIILPWQENFLDWEPTVQPPSYWVAAPDGTDDDDNLIQIEIVLNYDDGAHDNFTYARADVSSPWLLTESTGFDSSNNPLPSPASSLSAWSSGSASFPAEGQPRPFTEFDDASDQAALTRSKGFKAEEGFTPANGFRERYGFTKANGF